ncbi:MAG: S8 family peptidase [Bacteroidales bacterium]|nr:S8 family peptidase [Bacteroidales bacterium]
MLKSLAIFFVLFYGVIAFTQIAPDTYWVQFTDKNNSEYSLSSPEDFLSDKAIERRLKQGISFDFTDIPVNRFYIDSLKKLGLHIQNVSKWLNGVVIITTDTNLLDTLHRISFIADPVYTPAKESKTIAPPKEKFAPAFKDANDYYFTSTQIGMLNGDYLHTSGYRGEGITIAVLDAGFINAQSIESLDSLWEENRIIGIKDFVKDSIDMFLAHSHGTLVLSILAGIVPGNFEGSAPKANYVLVRTENGNREYIDEEYNWVCGAEYADSMGVDVINSSLGYSEFQDDSQNHTYADMNGRTTVVSYGALMAARKGMLVHCSAGNSGDDPWGYIIAPADADSIIAVGACDSLKIIANFSSRGNSSDNRVKPDITAMGSGTSAQIIPGYFRTCNGTSCSSPVVTGLSACLWQANRDFSAQDIRLAIIESADRYNEPDTIYGYGIPDYLLADKTLKTKAEKNPKLTEIKISPNPVIDIPYFELNLPWLSTTKTGYVEIYNLSGNLVYYLTKEFNLGKNIFAVQYISQLEKGFYFSRILIDGRVYHVSFLKQ